MIVRRRLVIIRKWKLSDLKEMEGGAFCGLERIGRRLGRAGIDSGELGVYRGEYKTCVASGLTVIRSKSEGPCPYGSNGRSGDFAENGACGP